MSLFEERLADLPLHIEGYALEGLTRDVSSAFTRVSTVIRMHGAGEEGVGEDVTYDAPDHEVLQAAGPVLPARRRLDAGLVLRPRRGARPVARAAPARGLAPVPRVGVRVDGARPRAAPGGHVAARRGGPRVAPGALRRLAAPGRAADPRPRDQAPGALPVAALQARPDHRVDARDHRRAGGHRRGRLGRLQGPIRRARSSTSPPIPSSTAAWSRPSPTPGSRTRSSPRRPTRSSCPIATASPGTRPSTASPTSRPCPSRRGWSTSSRRAWGRCARCSAPTSTARPAASGCTAAASSSSAPAAATSSTWPRSFTPTPPTTWRPAATTPPTRRRGCPDSPLAPMAHDTGFRWG